MSLLDIFRRKAPPTSTLPAPGAVSHRDAAAALEPWLALHRREAWVPLYEGDGPPGISQFGGRPLLRPQEEPPLCRACSRPLHLVLQLDGRETPAASPWTGPQILQFFYCNDCQVAADGWEPFSRSHHLRVLDVADGNPDLSAEGQPPWIPAWPAMPIRGWKATRETPHLAEQESHGLLRVRSSDKKRETLTCAAPPLSVSDVVPWAKDEQGRELWDLLGMAADGEKLGGWPYWVQGAEMPACPRCARPMVYVFQIDSDAPVPINLGDAGCGHLFRCALHQDTWAFSWECC